jgi:diacylglycerol kinase family enzyme
MLSGVRRLLIVNPAGSGVTPAGLAAVRAELEAGGPVEIAETERAGHATELASQACADCSAIYVFAGDGGFNEAVNGMHGSVPIGFIPGGASNILPRALGLPGDAVVVARRIARAERKRVISLGVVEYTHGEGAIERRRFTFCAGVGLDAELVRAVDRRGRRGGTRPGDLVFVSELLRLLSARGWRFDPALEIEGHGKAAFAIAANCDPYTYVGPLPVHAAPTARFELGLDVVAPVALRSGGLGRLAWWVLVRPTHPGAEGIVYLHDVDRAVIRCDGPMPLQVDGEDLGDVVELVLESERSALHVLV